MPSLHLCLGAAVIEMCLLQDTEADETKLSENQLDYISYQTERCDHHSVTYSLSASWTKTQQVTTSQHH